MVIRIRWPLETVLSPRSQVFPHAVPDSSGFLAVNEQQGLWSCLFLSCMTIKLIVEKRESFLLPTTNGNLQHLAIHTRFVEEALPPPAECLGIVVHHGRAAHSPRVWICSPAAFYVQPASHHRFPPNSPMLHR